MKKTRLKDTLRNIKSNFVSWLAVAIVTMIGCGSYCGAFFFVDAMEQKAHDFFEETNYEDLSISSVRIITEDEIECLRAVDGVRDIEGTYRITDAFLGYGQEELHSEIIAVTERVSTPELLEGNLPQESDECALASDTIEKLGIQTGDIVKVSFPGMKNAITFKVTGIIDHADQFQTEDTWYVFLPMDTMKLLAKSDGFNQILVDIDTDDPIFSDDYFSKLLPIGYEISDEINLRQQIPSADEPGQLISDRNDKEAFLRFKLTVQGTRGISLVFTLMFMIVVVIVIFYTVAVLIDGQKKLLGCLKAYGFRNDEIMQRYVIFSESAILFGMLCSIGLGFVIQYILRQQLVKMYCKMPDLFAFRLINYLILLFIELCLGYFATFFSVRFQIGKYSATQLINWSGSAPGGNRKKAGTQVGSLYSRLIIKNMLTDWPRVLTSIVIIASSCLLIGTGITCKWAYEDIPKHAAEEVTRYDIELSLPADMDISDVEEAVREYEYVSFVSVSKTGTFFRYGDIEDAVILIVADQDVYNDFLQLNTTDGEKQVKPNSRGILVQNRLAENLGLKKGSKIELYNENLTAHSMRINNVVWNYMGREIYLTGKLYQEIFDHAAEPNTIFVRMNETDRDAFLSDLTSRFHGLSYTPVDELPESLTVGVSSMIIIIIVLSLFLSVFVLLNLVNMFVKRRKNELIIMGINGFSYMERIGYLLREALITILAGILLGTGIGAAITETIVRVTENQNVLCVRTVNWKAWAIAAAIESLFAMTIYLIAFLNVKRLSLTDI